MKKMVMENICFLFGDQYECDVKGSLNARLLPVWYIGAIDLPYAEDKNILTVTNWNELRKRMEE